MNRPPEQRLRPRPDGPHRCLGGRACRRTGERRTFLQALAVVAALVTGAAGCPAGAPPPEVSALRESVAVQAPGLDALRTPAPRVLAVVDVPADAEARAGLALEGGRQAVLESEGAGALVRVLVEPTDPRLGPAEAGEDVHPGAAAYLGSGLGLAVGDRRVQSMAKRSFEGAAHRRGAVRALDEALARRLRPGWRGAVEPDAARALSRRRGECLERALVAVSVLRAAGIPARVAIGLAARDGVLVHHAWVEYWDDQWATWDPTWRLHPAPATHLRLAIWGESSMDAYRHALGRLTVDFRPR